MRLFPSLILVALISSGCGAQQTLVDQPQSAPQDVIEAPAELRTGLDTTSVSAGVRGAEPASATGPDGLGVLEIAVVGQPVLDPLEASVVNPTDMAVIDLLYDGLSAWDPVTDTWTPNLASRFEQSADGLSWTVSLAERTFSDGTAVEAGDVARSLERVRQAVPALPGTRLEMIDRVVVVDDATVRLEMAEPFSLLPALLSSPVYGIVPDQPLDGSVASGPMVVGPYGVLVPRPEVTVGLAGVALVEVETEESAIALLEEGSVDLVYVSSGFTGATDVERPSMVEAHFALNVQASNLQNVATRQAVANAVSRTKVTSTAFGDAANPVDRLIPTILACTDPCGGKSADEAIEISELRVIYVEESTGREADLAEAVVAELRLSGIAARSSGYTLAEFVALVGAGEYDLARTGWIGLFPSADSQLAPYRSDSPDNVSGYASDIFDGLVTSARVSGAAADYELARQHLHEDAAVLPIARFDLRALVGEGVGGLLIRHDGSIDLSSISVSG